MKNLYREAFDEVHASDRLRQEVGNMTKQEQRTVKRRVPAAALIAAVLVLALAGTAVAAVGAPGSLKGWFAQQWTEISGEEMGGEQTALIDRLTQQVGVSDTCGGVTVTLDSVTGGSSSLWLLLKISGDIRIQERDEAYYFGNMELAFSPEPDSQDTPGGYGRDNAFTGVAEDGLLTMLVRYTVSLTGEDSLLNGYDIELRVDDLQYSGSTAAEGSWVLPFSLEAVENMELLTLDGAQVPARNNTPGEGGEKAVMEIRDICVSATDIRFIQTPEEQMLYPAPIRLVLRDGTEVGTAGGGSRWTGGVGTGAWSSVYYWKLPVDPGQAESLRVGNTVIPLN